jgi:hypothetical protein
MNFITVFYMKKYLKQNADCSTNTMEFRDHFKNGASPKSLTSRENKKKSE